MNALYKCSYCHQGVYEEVGDDIWECNNCGNSKNEYTPHHLGKYYLVRDDWGDKKERWADTIDEVIDEVTSDAPGHYTISKNGKEQVSTDGNWGVNEEFWNWAKKEKQAL